MREIKENVVYTVKETEEILQISPSTMQRLMKKGLIRAAKVGKQYRILGKEILRVVSPELEDVVGKAYSKARNWAHEGEEDNSDK
ncbi:MAG: helix-turn-helix domain-containing protein [Candidatus Tantalella remota]|nr:helix-turn-helix domain-containing protein [Candidatus Tantalella remota]